MEIESQDFFSHLGFLWDILEEWYF